MLRIIQFTAGIIFFLLCILCNLMELPGFLAIVWLLSGILWLILIPARIVYRYIKKDNINFKIRDKMIFGGMYAGQQIYHDVHYNCPHCDERMESIEINKDTDETICPHCKKEVKINL